MHLFSGFCFFFRTCILSRRYFPFSPRLNRSVSRTKIKRAADEMSLHLKLKVFVEMKLKGKGGVIPWKTKTCTIKKKRSDKIRNPVTVFVKSRRLYQVSAVNKEIEAEDRLRRGSNRFGSARSVTSPSQRWPFLSKRISELFSRFP